MGTYVNTIPSDELYHYGVLGMKWGVIKDRPSGGSHQRAVQKAEKKHNKILNSDNPSYIYKHRKELSEDEFNKVYDKAYKTNELKKMAYGDRSVTKEIAISTGKEACKMVLKTAMAASTVAFLTKTDTGRNLVKSGKKAVESILKNAVINAEKTATNAAKVATKTAVDAVKTSAANKRASDVTKYKDTLKKGNKAVNALNRYGKTIDRIVRK